MAIARITHDDDGTFDELVASAESIHIERMDDDEVWMRVGDYMLSFWAVRPPWWALWRRPALTVLVQHDPSSRRT